jgi:hypothetical protein
MQNWVRWLTTDGHAADLADVCLKGIERAAAFATDCAPADGGR